MKTLQSGEVEKWFVIDVLIRIAGTVVVEVDEKED